MLRTLTVLALVTCATLCSGAPDDKKYLSKEGQYAVKFPPGASVKTEMSKVNDIEISLAFVNVDDKAYFVMCMAFPSAVKGETAKGMLDWAEKVGVSRTGGKAESSKGFEFGKEKYPGREIVADKDGAKARARLIIAGKRIYILTVGGPKDFATSDDATKFLDSFEIMK
jgi:hypothetical protein